MTNQPDVGHGRILRSEVEAMHEILQGELPIDTLKACFHRQDEHCDCRKPKPGMILGGSPRARDRPREELHGRRSRK